MSNFFLSKCLIFSYQNVLIFSCLNVLFAHVNVGNLLKLFRRIYSHLLQSSFIIGLSLIQNVIPWINFLTFIYCN